MTIQPIDVPSLLRAVAWPVFAAVALTVFRRQLGSLISVLGQKVSKLSLGKFSIEMAQVEELRPSAIETEIRQLEAGLNPQGDKAAIVNELQRGQHDYIVIDVGSKSSPRWLTSRLYLLCFLINLINRQLCIVFVETANGVRKKFVGTAFTNNVRWALARKYSRLESAGAAAYATQVGLYWAPETPEGYARFQLSTWQSNYFDPASGNLGMIIPSIIQQFLGSSDPNKLRWKMLWTSRIGCCWKRAKPMSMPSGWMGRGLRVYWGTILVLHM